MSSASCDASKKKIGILIVGIGGNNGVTLVAGIIANRKKLEWESSSGAGRVSAPNFNGCITQLEPRGRENGVGFKGRFPLADVTDAAISGWDIRSKPLGDALYDCRVLDYDLVRQVRGEMNEMPIMKGVYDASFLGESQHATATHIVNPFDTEIGKQMTIFDKVQHLRKDIRSFIEYNKIDGHVTVIWSASVERPADIGFESADRVLESILNSEGQFSGTDISPSMCYAVAAALEGCSFVNGGSQNTLSPGMVQLFENTYRSNTSNELLKKFGNHVSSESAYVLGTDFKAGQTKFKTAAVEYIRALGLTPKVIASSNHLGNNDMLNLTSKATINAKMRVKSNIFGPWEENELDHQVKVMYTPYMGDEKRDIVEYTSHGFLHCPHTMLTYTRCMDSVLCVPLMIDAAVWCDFFARSGSGSSLVAKATAYLFKIPEGAAVNVDPGFHNQMSVLEASLRKASGIGDGIYNKSDASIANFLERGIESGIITKEQADRLLNLG